MPRQTEPLGIRTITELDRAASYFAAAVGEAIERELDKLRREIEQLKEGREEAARPSDKDDDRYLNQRQAAKLLGCSTGYLRKLCSEGRFPEPTRLSPRDLRWSRKELLEWVEARRPKAQSPDASRNATT